MKYQDDAVNKTVNGFQVGVRTGSPMRDALAPADDGYDHLRLIEHVGTVLQDAGVDAVNPTSVE
jgi:hypothetical protein